MKQIDQTGVTSLKHFLILKMDQSTSGGTDNGELMQIFVEFKINIFEFSLFICGKHVAHSVKGHFYQFSVCILWY